MGQIKMQARQLVAEVLTELDGDRYHTLLVYDHQRLVGKISYDEMMAFLNYKKELGSIYYHKLNFELQTVLHLIREMRAENGIANSDYINKTFGSRFIFAAASAIVAGMLIFAGWWFIKDTHDQVTHEINRQVVAAGSIADDKAVLDLGNNRQINITDAAAGVVYADYGLEIEKTAKGQLIYHLKGSLATSTTLPGGANHKIRTPKGGFLKVSLADDTRIWLNAASEIGFPAVLGSSGKRRLNLHGEAYFEVAHDKAKPFLVTTKTQEIEVLGTRFNVAAYENDHHVKTTLLEGSIKISPAGSGASAVLEPGQQSTLTRGKLSVSQVDAANAAAWKEGEFVFRNMLLEEVLHVVERWYNVEVIYKDGDIKKALLGGTLIRSAKLDEVLSMLEITANVKCKLEGRKVIISK